MLSEERSFGCAERFGIRYCYVLSKLSGAAIFGLREQFSNRVQHEGEKP
jgi:hypothetical protein